MGQIKNIKLHIVTDIKFKVKIMNCSLFAIALFCLLGTTKPDDNHDHYNTGGEHNAQYDHEAFLGKEDAQTFDGLSLEESKKRLGEIFQKVDGQVERDGSVTEEELSKWILQTKNDRDGDGVVTWAEYKDVSYGFLNNVNEDNHDMEDHAESLRQDEKRFRQADVDGDKMLNREEFAAFLHPEDHEYMVDHMVDTALNDMDKNKDKFVSLEEYLADFWPGS